VKEVTCKFGKEMNRHLVPTGMKYKNVNVQYLPPVDETSKKVWTTN